MDLKISDKTTAAPIVNEIVLKENKIARKITFVTVIINLLLSFFKLFAGIFGSSGAMISDSIHSFSDSFVTLIAYYGVIASKKEADSDHPYGHERIECAATLVLGIILAFVGLLVGYSGIEKILTGSAATAQAPAIIALIAAIVSIITKELMYHYTVHYAKIINSNVFMADAWHHRSDTFSSVGALVGILGARMGYYAMDSVASVIICIFIIKISIDIIKDSIKRLLDTSCDENYVQNLKEYICSHKGVVCVDLLQTRIFGSKVYIDLEIEADGDMPLREAHKIAEDIHNNVENKYPEIKHIMIHINPAEK